MSKKPKDEEEKKTVPQETEVTAEETAEAAGEAEAAEEEELSAEEQLQKELDATNELLKRTAAEYANYRARSAKEKEQTFANAKGTVVAEIIPAVDNLERALGAENTDYEALRKGVEMTLTGLLASLEKLGVESFGAPGDSFDPQLHNAVMHVEDEALGENVITDVFQKGYKIGDRIVRAAMVKTAN